jgi:hypothetical protein
VGLAVNNASTNAVFGEKRATVTVAVGDVIVEAKKEGEIGDDGDGARNGSQPEPTEDGVKVHECKLHEAAGGSMSGPLRQAGTVISSSESGGGRHCNSSAASSHSDKHLELPGGGCRSKLDTHAVGSALLPLKFIPSCWTCGVVRATESMHRTFWNVLSSPSAASMESIPNGTVPVVVDACEFRHFAPRRELRRREGTGSGKGGLRTWPIVSTTVKRLAIFQRAA